MEQTINRIVDYAVKVADPEMIILYGSMANGCSNIYSDIDLLVIVQTKETWTSIANQILYYAQDLSLKADVLVHTGNEIGNARKEPDSFLSCVLKSGKVVYQKQQY